VVLLYYRGVGGVWADLLFYCEEGLWDCLKELEGGYRFGDWRKFLVVRITKGLAEIGRNMTNEGLTSTLYLLQILQKGKISLARIQITASELRSCILACRQEGICQQ
jgi:hypothetical protein